MIKAARISMICAGVVAILLALVPWYSEHLVSKAMSEGETRGQAAALHDAEKATAYNPFSVKAYLVLAAAEQGLGREAAARNALVKSTELQPRNYLTWQQLAVYERDYWGRPTDAAIHFQKAIELNPKDDCLRDFLVGCGDESNAGS